jgi:hypothetical protein
MVSAGQLRKVRTKCGFMRWLIAGERNQPPDGAFTVGVGAHEFGDVADGCGLGLDPGALAATLRAALRAAKVPPGFAHPRAVRERDAALP